MAETAHGASAGLRDRANIEIMHQRRYRKDTPASISANQALAETNATDLERAVDLKSPDGLNELDNKGVGV
jgi:hypothetical protein